jgi:hypothetical protein
MLGWDVEQHHGGAWLLVADLVSQRAAYHAIPEGQDNIGIGPTRELVTFF